MKKVCVITGTRAEYGLLSGLMKEIKNDPELELQIIATGAHLSSEFGLTYKQIEEDGFKINKKVDMHLDSDTPSGISKSMGYAFTGFADAFEELKPDIIVILGDRYEMLSVASTATIFRIPIAHISGGETTEGAIDEAIRHSITKMSHIHLTATEQFKTRVIQLGEQPETVYNVGDIGIDIIKNTKLLSKEEFEKSINFKLAPKNMLVTLHPTTLEETKSEEQIKQLLEALDEFKDANLIFTMPNADADGRIIIKIINEYVEKNKNRAVAFESLGQLRYLSALQYVDMVVGNSSSGIIEVPYFKIPTINIGDRQKGRLQAESTINCKAIKEDIIKAIRKGYSKEFQDMLKDFQNPYEGENVSFKIKEIIKKTDLKNILKKKFYNVEGK